MYSHGTEESPGSSQHLILSRPGIGTTRVMLGIAAAMTPFSRTITYLDEMLVVDWYGRPHVVESIRLKLVMRCYLAS